MVSSSEVALSEFKIGTKQPSLSKSSLFMPSLELGQPSSKPYSVAATEEPSTEPVHTGAASILAHSGNS